MADKSLSRKNISDIPIAHDATTRYVPWIIALLVFLLSLVLAGASSVSLSLYKWHSGVSNKVTIEIPVPNEQEQKRIVPAVLRALQSVPGILRAEPVDNQRLLGILEPWIGRTDVLKDLPMPILIDVDTHPETFINWQDVSTFLRQFSAGARIEHHSHWQEMLTLLRTSLQIIAYIFAFLIAITVVVTISLVTRSGLDTHESDINILRLLGANTSYISRQFQFQALRLSFKGAGIGFIIAFPAVLLLNWLSSSLGIPEILRPIADVNLVLLLISVPAIVVILSVAVARFAVMRTLARLI